MNGKLNDENLKFTVGGEEHEVFQDNFKELIVQGNSFFNKKMKDDDDEEEDYDGPMGAEEEGVTYNILSTVFKATDNAYMDVPTILITILTNCN